MAIKIEAARGNFSSLGGLHLFDDVIKESGLRRRVLKALPIGPRTKRRKSFTKFRSMIMGFVAGADCLSDMDILAEDSGFLAATSGKSYTSQNYGVFLRQFATSSVLQLQHALRDTAFYLRQKIVRDDTNLIIDLDSSKHIQYGKQEGVEKSYDHKRCLDSIQAYDQYGFQYTFDLRPGSTNTAKNAPSIIRDIFNGAPRRLHRYFRADSGYCNHGVMKACMDHNVDFVIAMREPMYTPLLKNLRFTKFRESKNIKWRDGRLCDVASVPYHPKESKRCLRAVIIRVKSLQPTLFDEYHYRAFVTNMGEHEMSSEEVVEFYRGRGNAENFIKESKNAYDMHHFPCQKLLANRIYGLMAAFAHNLMRCAAFLLNPKQLPYAKKIRFRMVHLGAQVVKDGQNWIIRLSKHRTKEVMNWKQSLKHLLVPG